MPRFYDVTGGAITIDGIDIRDVTLASLRRDIGIVQQDVFLFIGTIRDNIAYGASDATTRTSQRVAKLARIHDFIERCPTATTSGSASAASRSPAARSSASPSPARCLLDPKILIFDDSTSSVDTETEYLIQQALAELMKGRTTFVIAQRLRTVKAADQILVLQGRPDRRARPPRRAASSRTASTARSTTSSCGTRKRRSSASSERLEQSNSTRLQSRRAAARASAAHACVHRRRSARAGNR